MAKIPIIWNITKACPWNCSFCCISAYHLPSSNKSLDIELKRLRKEGVELSLEDKLRIVGNLDEPHLEIDVSGGEPLLFNENIGIIKMLSQKLGRENISITTTSVGLNLVSLDFLKEFVGEVGFTYDFPYEPNNLRPREYNSSNLNLIKTVTREGIRAVAQIPLTRLNHNEKTIRDIYENLAKANVNGLHLMKFFPVGRGAQRKDLVLTWDEYQTAVKTYRRLESSNAPEVFVQTALKDVNPNNSSSHLNITSKGLLLSDPWAYDSQGNPLKEYILGDLKHQKLSGIYKTKF